MCCAAGRPGDVRLAVRASLPAILAVLPMGMAFGVVVAQAPLPWWWAPVFPTVIFAIALHHNLLSLQRLFGYGTWWNLGLTSNVNDGVRYTLDS